MGGGGVLTLSEGRNLTHLVRYVKKVMYIIVSVSCLVGQECDSCIISQDFAVGALSAKALGCMLSQFWSYSFAVLLVRRVVFRGKCVISFGWDCCLAHSTQSVLSCQIAVGFRPASWQIVLTAKDAGWSYKGGGLSTSADPPHRWVRQENMAPTVSLFQALCKTASDQPMCRRLWPMNI